MRAADAETLILSDGFTCRGQIRQCTDREALHLAQVLRMALPRGTAPEASGAGAVGVAGALRHWRRGPVGRAAALGSGILAGALPARSRAG